MARRWVVTPRGGIAFEDGGEGEGLPVVLVHGAAGRAEHWAAQLAHLRGSRRAVAVELPGHGMSDPPADLDWTVEAMAEALGDAVEAAGLRRFLLAGHSLGGSAAAEYAAGHPERVAGLVFVDSGPWRATPEELERIRRGFRPAAYQRFTARDWFEPILVQSGPATRREVLAGLEAMPRANFMALTYGSAGYDLAGAAARYPGPKLALCAATTGIAARWSPPVEVVVVAGASHWLMMDAPDAVNAALDAFLERLS